MRRRARGGTRRARGRFHLPLRELPQALRRAFLRAGALRRREGVRAPGFAERARGRERVGQRPGTGRYGLPELGAGGAVPGAACSSPVYATLAKGKTCVVPLAILDAHPTLRRRSRRTTCTTPAECWTPRTTCPSSSPAAAGTRDAGRARRMTRRPGKTRPGKSEGTCEECVYASITRHYTSGHISSVGNRLSLMSLTSTIAAEAEAPAAWKKKKHKYPDCRNHRFQNLRSKSTRTVRRGVVSKGRRPISIMTDEKPEKYEQGLASSPVAVRAHGGPRAARRRGRVGRLRLGLRR